MVDDSVVAQPEQKPLGQVFPAHLDGDDDVLFAQRLDTVRNIRIQHTDVSLVHLDGAAVDFLGAGTGIYIDKLDHRMNVFRDIGKAGFLVNAYQLVPQQFIEGKEVYLPILERDSGTAGPVILCFFSESVY